MQILQGVHLGGVSDLLQLWAEEMTWYLRSAWPGSERPGLHSRTQHFRISSVGSRGVLTDKAATTEPTNSTVYLPHSLCFVLLLLLLLLVFV